jgi:hypothetical protein
MLASPVEATNWRTAMIFIAAEFGVLPEHADR